MIVPAWKEGERRLNAVAASFETTMTRFKEIASAFRRGSETLPDFATPPGGDPALPGGDSAGA
jgi:hypothetical protein